MVARREQPAKADAIDALFASFYAHPKAQGYFAMSGWIVNATVVAASRQRNTDDEKRAIEEGRIPDEWRDKPKKLAQKDRDARGTSKRAKAREAKDGEKAKVEIAMPVFGYKNPVSIGRAHGLIKRFSVTGSAAHDGARLADVSDKRNTASQAWADTAYRLHANEKHMEKNGFISKVHFRRRAGSPPDGGAHEGQRGEIEGARGGGDSLRRAKASSSSRLANRHTPVPSQNTSLTRSARLARKT